MSFPNDPGLGFPSPNNPYLGRVPPKLLANAMARGASGGTTVALDTTGATLIVVAVSSAAGLINTLSDSKGNVWTPFPASANAGSNQAQLFKCFNPIVGVGHTFTIAQASCFAAFEVMAWSNAADSDGQSTGLAQGAANSIRPGAIAPVRKNALIVSSFSQQSGTPQPPSDGLIVVDNFSWLPGAYYGLGVAYLLQPSAAPINPIWSWLGGGQNVAAVIASFS